MKKYNSFRDLFADVEKRDSYWSEKAITEFSVELYQLMRRRGLSKKDFAEKIGKSQRQCFHLQPIGDEQRPHEAVPTPHKDEDT